jgi:hypothetical protein
VATITVDLARHLVEHLAVILERFGGGKFLERAGGVPPIHVAQRHDVLAFQILNIAPALPADADGGDVQPLIGRVRARGTRAQKGEAGRGAGGGGKETPAVHGRSRSRWLHALIVGLRWRSIRGRPRRRAY